MDIESVATARGSRLGAMYLGNLWFSSVANRSICRPGTRDWIQRNEALSRDHSDSKGVVLDRESAITLRTPSR